MNEDEPVYGEACYKISLKNYTYFTGISSKRHTYKQRDRENEKRGEFV